MGKISEILIDKFNGGMVNDSRDPNENTCKVVSNFDVLTNPRKMTPYRSMESGDSAAATSKKQNFCIALRTGTTYSLYALGVKSGAATAEVLYKDLTTGASNDLDDATWASPSANQATTGTTSFNLFVYYKQTGLIYGARGGSQIWAFSPTGTAWDDSSHALTYTNIAQGLVASNDKLYVPYDNKIAVNNAGSWTDAALTLPSHLYITSICEHGNNLAIAVAPLSGQGNSYVYLWDKDATSWNEVIDWGSGILKVLDEVDGTLVGISLATTSTRFNDRVIFRQYIGGGKAVQFKEIITVANTTQIPIAKQKIDNRLFFTMLASYNGTVRDGVWSIGRSAPGNPFTLVFERPTTSSALLTSDSIKAFFFVDDFCFISYQSAGSFALSKTLSTATYTTASLYESKKFDGGDSSLTKKLIGVTVMTEYLPTAGQVVLKYRKDEETSWATIFTEATDNSISHSAINIESSGATLPEFKEIEFQILSTGGAEITGLSLRGEFIDKRLY